MQVSEFDIGDAPPPVSTTTAAITASAVTTTSAISTSAVTVTTTSAISTSVVMCTTTSVISILGVTTTSAISTLAVTVTTTSAISISVMTTSATSGPTTTGVQITDSIPVVTPIAISSFNTKPISILAPTNTTTLAPTNTTTLAPNLDKSNSSVYSIKVAVPDYKSTASTPAKDSTSDISPGKYSRNFSQRKTNQLYQQLNVAVLGISTRLAKLQDGIFSQLSRIESQLENLSGASTSTTSGSSSDDLWSGLDPDFVVGNINNACYLFDDAQQMGSSLGTCCNTLSMAPVMSTGPISNHTASQPPTINHDIVSTTGVYYNASPMPSAIPQLLHSAITTTSLTDSIMSPASTSNPSKILQMERFLGLTSIEINEMKTEACSRRNFAAKLVKHAFTEEERRKCNCRGKRGKDRLDPNRLNVIKALTYYHYPLKQGCDEDENWLNECVKAIDEVYRRKK